MKEAANLSGLLFLRFWIVSLLFELFSLRQNALSGRLVANLTERRLLPVRPNKQTSTEPVGMSQGETTEVDAAIGSPRRRARAHPVE